MKKMYLLVSILVASALLLTACSPAATPPPRRWQPSLLHPRLPRSRLRLRPHSRLRPPPFSPQPPGNPNRCSDAHPAHLQPAAGCHDRSRFRSTWSFGYPDHHGIRTIR